jgi:hypothetical protein
MVARKRLSYCTVVKKERLCMPKLSKRLNSYLVGRKERFWRMVVRKMLSSSLAKLSPRQTLLPQPNGRKPTRSLDQK